MSCHTPPQYNVHPQSRMRLKQYRIPTVRSDATSALSLESGVGVYDWNGFSRDSEVVCH